jgi:hypothetical protein
MICYVVNKKVRIGSVELERVKLPTGSEHFDIPPLFTGTLVPFAAYQEIRSIVRAQNINPEDLGAPWNTEAENAELEKAYIEAHEAKPDMPPLELHDVADLKLSVRHLGLSESLEGDDHSVYVSVLFSDDESGAGVKA